MSFGEIADSAISRIFDLTGEPAEFQRASGGDAIPVAATLDEPSRDLAVAYSPYAARESARQIAFPRRGVDTVEQGDTVTFLDDAGPQYRGRRFRVDALLDIDADVITIAVAEINP